MKPEALLEDEATRPEDTEDVGHKEPEERVSTEESNLRLMLPRVSIDAFAVNKDVLQSVEKAMSDRRATRVEAQIFEGGFQQAIARYSSEQPSDVIVIECLEPSDVLPSQIDALADLCPPSTRLLLVGSDNSVELYRKLLRLGVSDYLVRPVDPLDLIESRRTWWHRRVDPRAKRGTWACQQIQCHDHTD
jgi:pilus assembly protein CpaE